MKTLCLIVQITLSLLLISAWAQSEKRMLAHPEVWPKEYVPLNPGEVVWQREDTPPAFTLPALNGTFTFNPNINGTQSGTIFFAYNANSTFQNSMIDNYLEKLFTITPNNTQYVFLSYYDAQNTSRYLYSKCQQTMASLNYNSTQIQSWNSRLFFVTQPVSALTQGNNFIPSILNQWRGSLTYVNTTFSGPQLVSSVFSRLDARWPWSMSMTSVFASNKTEVAHFGDGCTNIQGLDVKGKIALISNENLSASCTWANKIIAAEIRGAVGAIVYQTEVNPLIDMRGRRAPQIPSTMIHHRSGEEMLNFLSQGIPVTVQFFNEDTSGFWFAIDSTNRLQEIGYVMYPSFQFLSYIGQFLYYQQQLFKQVATTAVSVPVFNQEMMHGPINATVKLPWTDISQIYQYDKVELDMSLNCAGKNDITCPHWDRTLQLLVNCDNPNATYYELGRWITPFRRGAGRWLSDVTPLVPLFSSLQCNFQFAINASGGGPDDPWRPSLTLRFSGYTPQNSHPSVIIPLFNGGTFNSSYNSAYQPVTFIPPRNTTKVVVSAIMSGHGCNTDCCCEFCATTHIFQLNNNQTIQKTFKNAGTPMGCAKRVAGGVEPNEYGTWLYGRDGWCDGENVFPWTTDITAIVNANEENQISYYAQYKGAAPNQGGYIILYSYLTFYTPAGSSTLEL